MSEAEDKQIVISGQRSIVPPWQQPRKNIVSVINREIRKHNWRPVLRAITWMLRDDESVENAQRECFERGTDLARFIARCIFLCVKRQNEMREYGIRSSVKAIELHLALLKSVENKLRMFARRPGVVREVYENALDKEVMERYPRECANPEHPAYIAPFPWFASHTAMECASNPDFDPKARIRALEACNELRGTPVHKEGPAENQGDKTILRVTQYSEDGQPQQEIVVAQEKGGKARGGDRENP